MDKVDNIKLEYPVLIIDGENLYHAPQGAEFFMDEHGLQWVKFFPQNGYRPGLEHIRRTENILVVRAERREQVHAEA